MIVLMDDQDNLNSKETAETEIPTVWTSNVVPAEIVRRPSAGGLRIFWLKSLANPDKIFKKIFFLHFF